MNQDAYCGGTTTWNQRLATLQPFHGIQERAVPDAERLFGLIGGEDRSACGKQTVHIS